MSVGKEFLDNAVAAGHSLIPRMEHFDRDTFRREYEAKGRPVILEGCMADWPAFQKWTPEFLKEQFGEAVCHASINLPSGASPGVYDWADFTKWMKLSEFVEFMRSSDKPSYMQQVPDRLLGDLEEWCHFDELTDLRQQNIYKNVFFGSDNTNSSLHYDMPENFLAQIYGAKQVYLFHPDQRVHIDTYPDSLRMSPVDPYAPDLAAHPKYANARGMVGRIEAGEIVFIPRAYWHQLRSIGESISVNCWYGHEASATYLFKVAACGGVGHVSRLALDFVRYGMLGMTYRNRLFSDVPTGKWLYDAVAGALRRRLGRPSPPAAHAETGAAAE